METETQTQKHEEFENGNHFLAVSSTDEYCGCPKVCLESFTELKKETNRLNKLVSLAETELKSNTNMPEEVKGKLRVAVGKSKMLLKKKFDQFEKLCLQNLGKEADSRFPVTVEDLAGYWDTIFIQIDQVYKIFEEIDILRKNNWVEPPPKPVSETRKLTSKKSKPPASAAEKVKAGM